MTLGSRTFRTLVTVALSGTLMSCGQDAAVQPGLVRVDASLAPTALVENVLKVRPNNARGTQLAFANAGPDTLLADGKLWEVRRDDKLVATLEIGTLRPTVHLERDSVRKSIVQQILSGAIQTIRVSGIDVSLSKAGDKTVFVWFGRGLFEVLQTRSKDPKPEAILQSLLDYQRTVAAWQPLHLSSEAS